VRATVARVSVILVLLASGTAAQVQHPEAVSLLGKPLFTEHPKGDAGARADADIAAARQVAAKDPTNADAAYALGQAEEAGGRLLDAIDAYTIAIEKHPDDARLIFARGRLLIVIRKFDIAIRDMRSASSTLPEARCRLAFVAYLKGEFAGARDDFKTNCPSSPWAAVAAARADRSAAPPPPSDDDLLKAYYAALAPLIARDSQHAREQLKKIVDKQSKRWQEDAYIAAEADLSRVPKKKKAMP